jgi:N-acetylglutamate synthase-like GNAT family acetyltransferase
MGLKMDGDEEAITTIIANAIAAPEGHLRLAKAEEFIIGEVERNRFNTERAVEIYTVAVDNSVWAWTKGTTLGKLMYRDYQRSGLGKKFAIELTKNFKKGSGVLPIEDQRPPRRFLRFLLGA